MADNSTLNSGAGGDTYRSKERAGPVKTQVVCLDLNPAGAETLMAGTMPVSAASLPLPTGAATAAKQPALGTAGAASADVLSVQGVASMTPLKTEARQSADYDTGGGTQSTDMVGIALPASGGPVGVSTTNPLPVEDNPQSRSDTFTGTGNGTAVDVSTRPNKYFALQVTETGTVTSWTVVLEGSLDGTTYSTIMSHTRAGNGSGSTLWNPTAVPCRFFRSRCSALTLGAGTNVVARILGMN